MAERHIVVLACAKCKNRNYHFARSERRKEYKLELKKYCRHCRNHTLHRETK